MKDKLKHIFSKISFIFSYIFLGLLVIFAILLIYYIVSIQLSRTKGYKPVFSLYTIVSPSMEPKISIYDCVLSIRSNKDYKEGDVVTFYSDYSSDSKYTITHRIVDRYYNNGTYYYITKGDNNLVNDEGTITNDNIIGKVILIIPKIGKLQFFLTSKYGWIVVILIPSLGILIYDLKKLVKLIKLKYETEEVSDNDTIEELRKELKKSDKKNGKRKKKNN